MAARLYRRANQQADCLSSVEKGLAVVPADSKHAEADLLYAKAEIEMEKSTSETSEKAMEHFQKCIELYKEANDQKGQNECSLEIINVLRRMRKFKESILELNKLEKQFSNAKYEGVNKHLIRINLMRGLILGLSGDKSIENKEQAVSLLKAGVEKCRVNGFILLESQSLNSLALVLFQVSAENVEKLKQAEKYLYDALNLNVYCGQTRSCFQQYRNLGLVHGKLAHLEDCTESKVNTLDYYYSL